MYLLEKIGYAFLRKKSAIQPKYKFFLQIRLNTYLGSFNEVILKNQLKQFDVVLCNILAEVIKEMIPNIYKCLRNNGEVIFSGILNSQKDEIIQTLIKNDLNLLDVSTRKDWACISAQKNNDLT